MPNRLNGDNPEINPLESQWISKIWEWYADSIPMREIRRRLIIAGARQRETNRIPWQIPWLYQILKKDVYVSGIQHMRWNGEVYEILYPVIIDPETAVRVDARREKAKKYPARNVKNNYLGMGLVYCQACNIKMISFTSKAYKNGKRTNRTVRYYRCNRFLQGYPEPGCPHTISVKKLDGQLWEKVWTLLDDRDNLELAIRDRLEALHYEEAGAEAEIEHLHQELANVTEERQWIITQARKGVITDYDMEYQLGLLSTQEKMIKAELGDKSLMVGDRGEKLLKFADQYRQRLREGLDWLRYDMTDPNEADTQFHARRKMVDGIVRRVNVFEDKSIEVEFVFDLSGEEIKEAPPWWQ